MVGHSAPGVVGIVISGGAGLQLGWALVAPRTYSRQRALIEAALVGVKLVAGVFAMLVFAAFVSIFDYSIAAWCLRQCENTRWAAAFGVF